MRLADLDLERLDAGDGLEHAGQAVDAAAARHALNREGLFGGVHLKYPTGLSYTPPPYQSNPPAQAGDEMPAAGVLAAFPRRVAGAEQLLVPHHARIGRQLPSEFVAHAEADFAGAQAGADAAIRIILARQAELDERLQDQVVGQQQLVFELEPARGMARWADEERRLHVDELWRDALEADRRPRMRRFGLRVEADPGHDIPPRADRPPEQHLRFGSIDDAIHRLALGPHDETIAIAADPRAAVPAQAGLAVHQLRLELIEQDVEIDRAIVHRVAAVIDVLAKCGERHERTDEREQQRPRALPACRPASLLDCH